MRRTKRVMERAGRRISDVRWWIGRNALSMVIIILLAVYCFLSYRTYVIQKKCFETVDLVYQAYKECTKELESYNGLMEESNNTLEGCYERLKDCSDYMEKLTGSRGSDPEGQESR